MNRNATPVEIPEATTCSVNDLHESVQSRKMSEPMMRRLIRSMRTFGFVQPIVARGSDGLIIGGLQRLEAYKLICEEDNVTPNEVPVIWLDVDDGEATALHTVLNTVSGEWDCGVLHDVADDVSCEDPEPLI